MAGLAEECDDLVCEVERERCTGLPARECPVCHAFVCMLHFQAQSERVGIPGKCTDCIQRAIDALPE